VSLNQLATNGCPSDTLLYRWST